MEKKEKAGKFGKSVLWAVVSYVVISVIAGACYVLQGGGGSKVSGFMIFEVILFPVLFYAAGYFGSKLFDFEKFKTYKIWLFAACFSAVLLLLWYVFQELYVLLSLPSEVGSLAVDLFLRKITIVKDYTVLYLKETDGYKYVVLPLIHFVFRLVYWLLYALGNRKYAMEQKEKCR